MPNLLIIRGLPGSGKSIFAKSILNVSNDCALVSKSFNNIIYTHHYEADMFFENDGIYNFQRKFVSFAHDWCYTNVIKSLLCGNNTIVSNTFVKFWELEKYLDIPYLFNNSVAISVIELCTQFDSIHNVPTDTIKKMKANWEEIPQEIAQNITITQKR